MKTTRYYRGRPAPTRATPKSHLVSLLMLGIALVTTSCKSIHTAPTDFDFKSSPGVGLAIISTRIDSHCKAVFAGASIEYRSEVDGSTGIILLDNSFVQRDFEDPPGYLFVKPLQPGVYVLGKLSIPNRRAVHPLGVDFTVPKGRAVYLGQFEIQVPDCSSFKYRISDQWERDAPMIRDKYPNIRLEDVDLRIMRNPLMPARLP